MSLNKKKLNSFLFFKLPSAWWCGVRVSEISRTNCIVKVKHKWFNQNPFNSMYFAVQAMAAELSTGALVIRAIKESDQKISMLVAQNNATFSKKARGVITFTCLDAFKIQNAIDNTIETGEGQTFWLSSTGINEAKEEVCQFSFEWTVRVKK